MSVHDYESISVYSYVCSPKSPHSPNNESVDGIVTIQVCFRSLKGHPTFGYFDWNAWKMIH